MFILLKDIETGAMSVIQPSEEMDFDFDENTEQIYCNYMADLFWKIEENLDEMFEKKAESEIEIFTEGSES